MPVATPVFVACNKLLRNLDTTVMSFEVMTVFEFSGESISNNVKATSGSEIFCCVIS